MSNENHVSVEATDNALLIRVLAKSMDEPVTEAVQDAIVRGAPAGSTGGAVILLDMSKVDFAPSIALGALVKMTKTLKLDGRRLILAGVQPRVRGTIEVTRLHKMLEIFPTVQDALRSVKP